MRHRCQPTSIPLRLATVACSSWLAKQTASLELERVGSLYETKRISDAVRPNCFMRSACSPSMVVSTPMPCTLNSGRKDLGVFSIMFGSEVAQCLSLAVSSGVPQWISAAPEGNCTVRVTFTLRGSIAFFSRSSTAPESGLAGIRRTPRLSSFRLFLVFLLAFDRGGADGVGIAVACGAAGFASCRGGAGAVLCAAAA